MAKLKNIIKELSENDYTAVYDNLSKHGAEKSAYLLQALREMTLSDGGLAKALTIPALHKISEHPMKMSSTLEEFAKNSLANFWSAPVRLAS